MMPSAKMVSWSSAPPEKTLIRLKRLLPSALCAVSMHSWTLGTLTPGAGVIDPSRNTTRMNSTNSSFRRRSGVLNALTKAPSTRSSHLSRSHRETHSFGTLTVCLADHSGRTAVVTATSHDRRNRAATRLDLLLRRLRNRVGRHLDGHRDLSGPQDLDRLLRPD